MKELYKLACARNIEEIERRVNANEAEIQKVDETGMTLIMKLVRGRNFNRNVFDTLLRLGISVNATDNAGRTALMYAARGTGLSGAAIYKGSLTIASYLISKGAEMNLRDNYGRTALGHAINDNEQSPGNSNGEMVKYLKKEMLAEAAVAFFSRRHSFTEEGVLKLNLPSNEIED